MDISEKYKVWKSTVVGTPLDIDRAYGAQCADVALSWGITIFSGVAWNVLFKPVQSAKDMYDSANPAYFDKIPNDHTNINQLPVAGDIAVFAAAPEAGFSSKYKNPDGHIGVVDRADQNTIYLVQQDGSTNQTRTQLVARPWRYTRCIGWLRPKAPLDVPSVPSTGPANHPLIGRQVWFKPPAKNPEKGWAVYAVGQFPDRSKAIGFMRPDWYHEGPNGAPGFIKQIIGVSQYANTVTIVTDTWKAVDVYLDGDAQIL